MKSNTKTDIVVDYASPCMKAERALKDLHKAMLEQDYARAIEFALHALAETKLTLNAIKHSAAEKYFKE
jgi:hypothetical protein